MNVEMENGKVEKCKSESGKWKSGKVEKQQNGKP